MFKFFFFSILIMTAISAQASNELVVGGCGLYKNDTLEVVLPPTTFKVAVDQSKVVYQDGDLQYIVTPQKWKENDGKFKTALDIQIKRGGVILAHSRSLKVSQIVLTAEESLPGITCW